MRRATRVILVCTVCLMARGLSETPDIDSRAALAREKLDAGQSELALSLAREILAAPTDTRTEAAALETLVNALVNLDRGEDEEATAGAKRCLELRQRDRTTDPADLARAHSVVARVLRAQRNYDQALAAYQLALDGLAPVATANAEVFANIRMNRANLLVSRGRVEEALPELEAVLLSYREQFGETHRLCAFAHYNLARAQERAGEIEAALSNHESAVRIRTALLPVEASLLATSAHEYGELLLSVGAFSAAREQFAQALALRERELGPEARGTLDSLDKLGDVELELGRPELAREHFERAQASRRATLPPDHVDLARSEHNLGNVALDLGDWPAARARFEAALALREAQPKRNAQREAEELNNLAVARSEAGDPAAAEAIYRRLLELHLQVLPAEHVDLAKDRLNLALARLAQAAVSEADALVTLAFAQLVAGDDPVALRSAQLVRGHVRLAQELPEQAESDFRQAVQGSEKLYGSEHVETAYALEWLARSLWRQKEWEAALDAALRAERISRRDLRERTRALPEREALRYREAGHVGLGLALRLAPQAPARWTEIYDAVVRSRALVLDELTARDAAATSATKLAQRQRARERYSFAVARGATAEELERLRLAKELGERGSATSAARESEPEVGASEVFAALRPRELLLSFVLAEIDDEADVVAILCDRNGVRSLRHLESVDVLLRRTSRWRSAMLRGDASTATEARALDRILLEPFDAELAKADRIFVVAAGPLHLLPFTALLDAAGRHRLEMPALWHLLDAERDRVAFAATAAQRSKQAMLLAVGGADFGPTLGETPPCPSLATLRFEPLPGSAREVEAIAKLWSGPRTVLRGSEATEQRLLREIGGAQVVHLATHGYFLPRECGDDVGRDGRQRGLGRLVRLPGAAPSAPSMAQSPLLRSGLALAFANQRSQSRGGHEDGILSAEELGGLDLRHVEWFVLSACDTGLGELQSGEGVLGLRRALRRAGAASVVMSLWPVDDESTEAWMVELYRARFVDRLDTAQSVQKAQQKLLARQRERGDASDPLEWAAFVAVGDWR